MAGTLAEKVWDAHVVRRVEGEPDLLYIDLHLVHEVTSPQAFEGLRLAGRRVRRPDLTLGTMDHSTPTRTEQVFGGAPIVMDSAAKQVRQLEGELGIALFARAGRGLVLTEAGRRFRPEAERVLADIERARDAVQEAFATAVRKRRAFRGEGPLADVRASLAHLRRAAS